MKNKRLGAINWDIVGPVLFTILAVIIMFLCNKYFG